jgi:RHS repeat-associated protein
VGNENWDVWADLDGSSSLTTRYVRGDVIDQLFARIEEDPEGDIPYWYLTDHLGSIRDVIDGSAVVKNSITYDGFGNITAETDSNYRGRYAWTGREIDVEIKLQYNRARYYDTATGRWMSQDPLGFNAGDSNLYRYVSNHPIALTDPSGKLWEVATAQHYVVDPIVNKDRGEPDDPRYYVGTVTASLTAEPRLCQYYVTVRFSSEVPAQRKGNPPKEYPAGVNIATEWFLRRIIESPDKNVFGAKATLNATYSPTPIRVDRTFSLQEWQLPDLKGDPGGRPFFLIDSSGVQGSWIQEKAPFRLVNGMGAGFATWLYAGPAGIGGNIVGKKWSDPLQPILVQWKLNALEHSGGIVISQIKNYAKWMDG